MTDNVAVTAAGAWPSDLAWRSGRNGVPKLLARDQFRGRGPGLRSSEVPGVLDLPRALVFLQVGAVDRVLQLLAPRTHGADRDLTLGVASPRGESSSRSARARHLVEIFHVRPHRAVDPLHLRVRRLDQVVFVRRVRAAAVAQSEVARREPQRLAGEHVAGPRPRVPRQEDGVDPGAPIYRLLRLDDHGVRGCAGATVTAREP